MTVSATGSGEDTGTAARRQNAVSLLFFLLIVVAFLIRFCISPQMMNSVVQYTSEAGAIYEKIHFGTYAIDLLVPIVLFSRPIYLQGEEIGKFKALLRYCGLLVAMMVLLIAFGRTGSVGIYVDTYLVAGIAGLLMFAVNAELRRAIGNVIVCMLLLSAALGTFEAVTQIRIFPYGANEQQFRPLGLSDHPLTLGMMCASAMGFVAITRWRAWVKVAAILLLFIGCAASGARFSLLLGSVGALAMLIFVPWPQLAPRHERQAKLVVMVLTAIGGAALIAVLLAGGLLSRFSGTLFDENFMARITVYEVFGLVDLRSILFGADLNVILRLINERLNLPFIESTPVFIVFQLGLPLALAFAALVFWTFGRLLRGVGRPAWIAMFVFFTTALSNNLLSSKTPVITIFMVLLIAFGAPGGASGEAARTRQRPPAPLPG